MWILVSSADARLFRAWQEHAGHVDDYGNTMRKAVASTKRCDDRER